MSTDGGAVWNSFPPNGFYENYCTLKVSDYTPGLVFFGGLSSTASIYRSEENGLADTWEIVLESDSPWKISAIEQSAIDPAHFVACGMKETAGDIRFYNSYDYGETWEISSVILSGLKGFDLLLSSSVTGRYLCATDNGIYRTEDGTSYTRVLEYACNDLEYDSDFPGVIFAGCVDSGIYVSEDEGNSWEALPDLYRNDIEIEALQIVGEDWLYAGTDDFGIFRLELNPQGINEAEREESKPLLGVTQSPCEGSVTIIVPPLSTTDDILIYDVTGRVAYRERVDVSADQQNIVVSTLSPGVYFTGISAGREFCRFVILSK